MFASKVDFAYNKWTYAVEFDRLVIHKFRNRPSARFELTCAARSHLERELDKFDRKKR